MANERNIAALEQLLRELDPEGRCFGSGGPARAAQWLASRGVLATGCVTDEDARDVLTRSVRLVPAGAVRTNDGEWLRTVLNRIAHGNA
jgi:hypothetical protein